MNIERNDDRTDGVRTLAIGGRWPARTWRNLLERALFLADRAHRLADRSGGRVPAHRDGARPRDPPRAGRHAASRPTAGLLTIEGAHALGDDPANVEVVADAGFRMISPAHFFDTAFGGSAHGVEQHGLTPRGREMLPPDGGAGRAARRRARVGPHDRRRPGRSRPGRSSPRTRASAACATTRATSRTTHLAGIAATGGLVGIGFWPTACGGDDAAVDRALDRLRRGPDRRGPRRARLGLGRRGPGAVRRGPCRPADGRAARRRPRRGDDPRRHGRERAAAARRSGCLPPDEPDAQTRSAISAAARAAPFRSTGREVTGRSISSAMAAAMASGSEAS